MQGVQETFLRSVALAGLVALASRPCFIYGSTSFDELTRVQSVTGIKKTGLVEVGAFS